MGNSADWLMACGQAPAAAGGSLTLVGRKSDITPGIGSGTWTTSLTDLSDGVDTAPSEGDFVIVAYAINTSTQQTPSVATVGYTQYESVWANDSYDTNLTISGKFMGETPDTLLELSRTTNGSFAGAVMIEVWRGVDEVAPFETPTQTATGSNNPIPVAPAITPFSDGAHLLFVGACAHGSGTQTLGQPVSGDPWAGVNSVGSNSGYDVTVGIAYDEWTGGTYPSKTFSFSGGSTISNSWAAASLALRPA